MSAEGTVEKAFFVIREPNAGPPRRSSISRTDSIAVNFNPTSLQYVITNTPSDPSRGNKKKQYVSKSTAKLTMDLIFDSTDTGIDVRTDTQKIAKLMVPDKDKNSAPPLVLFAWGNFMFQGMVDGFKETLDFFSANGIPLRSSVNVTMSQQDNIIQEIEKASANTKQSLALQAVEVPPSPTANPTTTAAQGGDSRAARDIAASNGLESTRFGSGAPMTVGKSPQLKPPLAFASGGASGGAAQGGLSAGAGVSLGGGAGISGGSIGGSASAGVSAGEGAFAGLRTSASSKSSFSLNPGNLIQRSESLNLATDAGARFSVGGKATVEGSSSLKADVGVNADLRSRIQFDQ